MIYVGMDVSSKSFEIYAVNAKGKRVFKGAIEPTRMGLKKLIEGLGREKKVFVFEAGNQMKWIAETLKKADQLVHVVHPNEVKWITQSRGKTDKVDAKKLAELARIDGLPRAVLVVEGKERKLRELISARGNLMSKRVAMINTIQGYVKQEGRKMPKGFFSKGAEWTVLLSEMKITETLKDITASLMNAIEALKKSEDELSEKIKAVDDKKIELIKTIPTMGDLSSRILFSALVNAKRFENKKKVANYGALTPTIYQSGNVTNMGHINRDGRSEVRQVLIQCAHTLARTKNAESKPLREFFERIEKKRGKKIAIIALSRKLLTTVYGVLKTGEVYDPRKLQAYAA